MPAVQSAPVPPPYYGFSLESALRANEPPAYDDSTQGNAPGVHVVTAAAAAASATGSSNAAQAYLNQDIAELRTTDEGVQVLHYLSPRDTLVGICLKYNVKVGRCCFLKRACVYRAMHNVLFDGPLTRRRPLATSLSLPLTRLTTFGKRTVCTPARSTAASFWSFRACRACPSSRRTRQTR